jgi:hypothetical protein
MHWNYRIIRTDSGDTTDPDLFQIHEVYYDAAGNPTAYTERGIAAAGGSPEAVIAELERMLECARKHPPMSDEDFKKKSG